jgi:hypothetical protein
VELYLGPKNSGWYQELAPVFFGLSTVLLASDDVPEREYRVQAASVAASR